MLSGYLPELYMGLSSLLVHKLRSLLTMLGIEAITPRKRFKPLKALPKTNQELPQLIGVLPNYKEINNLKVVAGRFFDEEENLRSEAVCVVGEAAKVNLLGFDDAIGKYVKINEVWLQVIGVMAP